MISKQGFCSQRRLAAGSPKGPSDSDLLLLHSHVEAITTTTPHVTALEIGPLRRWLRLNEVRSLDPWSDRTGALIRRDRRESSPHTMEKHREKLEPCKLGRELSLEPWSQTSSCQSCATRNFCCLSQSGYGILLRQPVLIQYFSRTNNTQPEEK